MQSHGNPFAETIKTTIGSGIDFLLPLNLPLSRTNDYWIIHPSNIIGSEELFDGTSTLEEQIPAESDYALDTLHIKETVIPKTNGFETIIDRKELIGTYKDISSVLEQLSGISIQRTGGFGEYSTARIRGSSASHVQVYLDGILLNSAYGGAVDLSKIPLQTLSQIQVFRASAPIQLQENSSGAVINLITEPNRDIITTNAEMGSYGYTKVGTLIRKHSNAVIHRIGVDYSYARNDYPYLHDNQTPFNPADDYRARKINNGYNGASITYAPTLILNVDHTIRTNVSFSKQEKQIHVKYLGTDWQKQRARTLMSSLLGMVDYSYDFSKWFSTHLLAHIYTTHSVLEDPVGTYYIPSVPKQIEDNFFKFQLQAFNSLYRVSFLKIQIKLNGEQDQFTSINRLAPSSAFIPQSTRYLMSCSAELDATPHKTTNLVARYTQIYCRDYCNFSPSIGVTVNSTCQKSKKFYQNGSFKAIQNLGEYASFVQDLRYDYLPISFFDLFGKGDKYIGNPLLKPEKRTEISAGFELRYAKQKCGLNIFGGYTYDKIAAMAQTQTLFRSENIGFVKTYGLEAELSIKLRKIIHGDNSFTIMSNTFLQNQSTAMQNQAVPYSPKYTNSTRITFYLPQTSIGCVGLYKSSFYYSTISNNQELLPGTYIINSFISIKCLRDILITYRVENCFDKQDLFFYNNTLLPGRMHYFVVHYEF